jgi:hypothetical protein
MSWIDYLSIGLFMGFAIILVIFKKVDHRLIFLSSIMLLVVSGLTLGMGLVLAASVASIISYCLLLLGLVAFVVGRGEESSRSYARLMNYLENALSWLNMNVDSGFPFLLSIVSVVICGFAMATNHASLANTTAALSYLFLLLGIFLLVAKKLEPRVLAFFRKG